MPLVLRTLYSIEATAMPARRELEIKLALPPASVGRLSRIPLMQALKASVKRATEVSVYFDTDKHKLRKNGLMLRVRRIGNRYLQTIKASGDAGLFERGEWESEIADGEPDLGLVRDTPLKTLMNGKLRRQLKPMFETRVNRTVYALAKRAHVIELAIDRGKIDTGVSSLRCASLSLNSSVATKQTYSALRANSCLCSQPDSSSRANRSADMN